MDIAIPVVSSSPADGRSDRSTGSLGFEVLLKGTDSSPPQRGTKATETGRGAGPSGQSSQGGQTKQTSDLDARASSDTSVLCTTCPSTPVTLAPNGTDTRWADTQPENEAEGLESLPLRNSIRGGPPSTALTPTGTQGLSDKAAGHFRVPVVGATVFESSASLPVGHSNDGGIAVADRVGFASDRAMDQALPQVREGRPSLGNEGDGVMTEPHRGQSGSTRSPSLSGQTPVPLAEAPGQARAELRHVSHKVQQSTEEMLAAAVFGRRLGQMPASEQSRGERHTAEGATVQDAQLRHAQSSFSRQPAAGAESGNPLAERGAVGQSERQSAERTAVTDTANEDAKEGATSRSGTAGANNAMEEGASGREETFARQGAKWADAPDGEGVAARPRMAAVRMNLSDELVQDQPILARPSNATIAWDAALGDGIEAAVKPVAAATTTYGGSEVRGMAHPFATSTFAPERVIARIVETVERFRDAVPARTVTLRLDPPELGTVEVTVRARGRSVEATLVTQHDWVRQVVELHRPQLESQLNQKGLELGAFDVSTQARADDQGTGGTRSHTVKDPAERGASADSTEESELAKASLHPHRVDLRA